MDSGLFNILFVAVIFSSAIGYEIWKGYRKS